MRNDQPAAPAPTPRDATVVVVGAGLSGLVTARALHERGIDVLVLEAADRVGGRAFAETTALGSRVDLGGQWIGGDHHRLTDLGAELGLTKYLMYTDGTPPLLLGGRRRSAVALRTVPAFVALLAFELLSRTGRTARWNDVTLADLVRRVPGETSRRLLDLVVQVAWTTDPDRISLHTASEMLRTQGGLRTMMATRGGAQDALFVEGVGTIAERIAGDLGDRVRTGARVLTVERDDDGVTVTTAEGRLRAAKVVITVPAPMAAQIGHHPPLPRDRAELERSTYMGTVRKAIAVYDRPFWRERGGAELLVLDGPAHGVFDSSPPEGPGHLCMLLGGSAARELDGLDEAARREALLRPLVPTLGEAVLRPASWHEKAWHHDPIAGGGYVYLAEPGTPAATPAAGVHRPAGNLHWAGSETATDHPGYFEGAIQSGARAAAEVAAALDPARTARA